MQLSQLIGPQFHPVAPLSGDLFPTFHRSGGPKLSQGRNHVGTTLVGIYGELVNQSLDDCLGGHRVLQEFPDPLGNLVEVDHPPGFANEKRNLILRGAGDDSWRALPRCPGTHSPLPGDVMALWPSAGSSVASEPQPSRSDAADQPARHTPAPARLEIPPRFSPRGAGSTEDLHDRLSRRESCSGPSGTVVHCCTRPRSSRATLSWKSVTRSIRGAWPTGSVGREGPRTRADHGENRSATPCSTGLARKWQDRMTGSTAAMPASRLLRPPFSGRSVQYPFDGGEALLGRGDQLDTGNDRRYPGPLRRTLPWCGFVWIASSALQLIAIAHRCSGEGFRNANRRLPGTPATPGARWCSLDTSLVATRI